MTPDEWNDHEARALRRRHCPYSGLLLSRGGNAGDDAMSCRVCDCFGYDIDDERIGNK